MAWDYDKTFSMHAQHPVAAAAAQGEFNALRDSLMRAYPDRAALFFSYDEPLSHLIYAASDMFLVPSMFEPCGLTQVRCAVSCVVELST